MIKKYMLRLTCGVIMVCSNIMSGEESADSFTGVFGNSISESENENRLSGVSFRVVDETEIQSLYSGFSLTDLDERRFQEVVENSRKNYKDPVLVCGLFFQEEDRLHRMIFSIETDRGKIQAPDEMTFHIEEYLDVKIEHLEANVESQSLMSLKVQVSVFYSSRLFDKVDRLIDLVPNTRLPVVDKSSAVVSSKGEKLELQSYILFYLVMPDV